jgi:ornithine carbamoyltransferase
MIRHLLDVTDFTAEEVRRILSLVEKPSNRTRHSMEMAVSQLGGHPIYTRGEEVGFDTREPVEDVAKVMQGYHALIAARVFDHLTVTRMAAVVDVPVVNMLSDHSHPLQAFADALTMQQCLGDLADKTVAYVGDFNNVARSLGEVSALLGMHIRFACPHGFDAPLVELERFELLGAASVDQSHRPADAVAGAHAVHTDTWVSMGQEAEKQERMQQFEGYTVDADMMALADPTAVFMHCLPAYRGIEVAADVIDGPQSAVFQQAHNRLHAARGALAFLLGVRDLAGTSRTPTTTEGAR